MKRSASGLAPAFATWPRTRAFVTDFGEAMEIAVWPAAAELPQEPEKSSLKPEAQHLLNGCMPRRQSSPWERSGWQQSEWSNPMAVDLLLTQALRYPSFLVNREPKRKQGSFRCRKFRLAAERADLLLGLPKVQ